MEWINLAQDVCQWREVMNTVITEEIWPPSTAWEFAEIPKGFHGVS
jgi:hypothetical protein